MEFKRLSKSEVSRLYDERMVRDFVKEERKPLGMILDLCEAGKYDPLGVFDDDIFVGYTFFQKAGADYLLDYFSVLPEKRNAGIGSRVLSSLREFYKDADSIILEVEDPERAVSLDTRELQERRLCFYLRNEVRDSDVKTVTFTVPFKLLEIPVGGMVHSREEVAKLYEMHYRDVLSDAQYARNVCIME